MKLKLFFLLIFAFASSIYCKTIVVDINGSGNYISIAVAINIAQAGDTVKVLPGVYSEQLNITKAIVIEGSGYETTTITSSSDPTITMSDGKIMWFSITSTGGSGILLSGGTVTNCILQGCSKDGITINGNSNTSATCSITNCVLFGNGNYGVYDWWQNIEPSVQNCISINNGQGGFYHSGNYNMQVNYCDGSTNGTNGNVGNISVDPVFSSSSDFHLTLASPCLDTGNPALFDPDGTRSDIGYFGGPDCPIYPVVTQIKIIPQQSGGIQIQASAQANY